MEGLRDSLEIFIKNREHFCLFILGINSEFSNHHMYASRLTYELNQNADTPITHVTITNLTDIEHDLLGEFRQTGLIISSDIILDPTMADLIIFVEISGDVLQKRGEVKTLDIERWKQFKEKYPVNKYIYDNVPFKFTKIDKIKIEEGTFKKISDTVIEFVNNNI